MSAAIVDALLGFMEHAGELWSGTAQRLPSRGARLRVRNRVSLSGRDLRPESAAVGFVAVLPPQAIVRVEDITGEDAAGLWVRPSAIEMLSIVPPECRAAAAAYGYALEIPPGILAEYFEILPHAL